MFEHRRQPLVSQKYFYRRVLRSVASASLIILFSLGIGILGYHHFGGLSWLDSMLNASMILTGMGPVNAMESEAGKLFASFYALFSGIAFLTVVAVFFAPIIHRFLHKFHLEAEEEELREKKR